MIVILLKAPHLTRGRHLCPPFLHWVPWKWYSYRILVLSYSDADHQCYPNIASYQCVKCLVQETAAWCVAIASVTRSRIGVWNSPYIHVLCQYPTQSHYHDTELTSPYSIYLMLSENLGSEKYQFDK